MSSEIVNSATALRELRDLVATYLECSDDEPRATELLDVLAAALASGPAPASQVSSMPDDQARAMFGCTTTAIDEALAGKDTRDIAMYAIGTLSNAQEFITRSKYEGEVEWAVTTSHRANTIRQFMNIAKYAIDKAVPR